MEFYKSSLGGLGVLRFVVFPGKKISLESCLCQTEGGKVIEETKELGNIRFLSHFQEFCLF